MSTIAQPTIAPPVRTTRAHQPSTGWYWIAGAIAVAALVGGVAVGISSYRDTQRRLDAFDRVAIPGTVTVDIAEPTGRVIYYEGVDAVRFEDLTLGVTDPNGVAVDVSRYDAEMVYETIDLTKGTAIATFTAERAGAYMVSVDGADTGELTIGDSFARRALPGVLTGVGIAVLGVIGGLMLALVTVVRRSRGAADARSTHMTLTETRRARPDTRRAGPGLALQVDHVTKRYGHNTVVDDVSFTVEPGRVTGFLGPNGSGKSTTMKILLDLAAADHGHASIGGVRYRDLTDPARTVGVVLEPNAFHPGRSARKHLEILADTAGISTPRVREVLELVGLDSTAHRHVGAFSLGMKQRLSLAGALLGDPPVLVLDEPGNGLDPQGIRALRELLRSRADNGHTVFLSSHLLAEVEHLADEVIVLNQGRLVTSGPLHELQTAATRVRSPAPDRLREALRAAGALVEPREGDLLIVRGVPTDTIGEVALHAGVALHELAADTSSLEELFVSWTGSGSSMTDHTTSKETAS